MAFHGLNFRPGDRILTATAEYASNGNRLSPGRPEDRRRHRGDRNDQSGQVSLADLRRRLRDGKGPVKLVAITHVSQGGLANPPRIGAATREAGVLYLLAAHRSLGQLKIDVDAIGCDLLSAIGRKYLPERPGSPASEGPAPDGQVPRPAALRVEANRMGLAFEEDDLFRWER